MPINDLVEDRAVRTRAEDLLGHAGVADDLADIVQHVSTPANIALYAPWGSGKTGLANLLGEKLNGLAKLRFLRFDAFKYAEAPLRRHFLSQVAKGLEIHDDKYSVGLYRETTDTTVHLPARDLGLIAALFVGVVVVIQVAVTLGTLAWTSLTHQAFSAYIGGILGSSVVVSFPTAALVAVLVTLGGRVLPVTRKRAIPSGDEEFERLFRELVAKLSAERLVVFIDELDRCSPEQVVSALETLRTFLEVPKCVFIVAADQQVLEEALGRRLSQATPVDSNHPYYSAGGAYLDKIFQYQLSLPPVMPRRLSALALALVEGKLGVWSQVPSRADIVSILVATHVTSPRRVKVLLNSYAMTYRMAAALEANPDARFTIAGRFDVLAKLVCLRVEFPLFARDLVLDTRLPELVLRAYDELPQPPDVSKEVWLRAKAYTEDRLFTDTVLAESNDYQEVQDERGTPSDSDSRIRRTQSEQLIRYLRRTQDIGPITRDLVYMESAGAAFGLPTALADALERDAVDGAVERVAESVSKLGPSEQIAAMRFLAREAAEAAIGIEARNVFTALLSAVQAAAVSALETVGNELADAVVATSRTVALQGADAPAMLRLASQSDPTRQRRLANLAASQPEVGINPDLAVMCLPYANLLDVPLVAEVTLTCLSHQETIADCVHQLPGFSELDEIMELVSARYKVAVEAAANAASDEETSEFDDLISTFTAAIDEALESSVAIAQRLAAIALDTADEDFVELVNERRDRLLGLLMGQAFATSALTRLTMFSLPDWPAWLEAIALAPDSGVARTEQLDSLADHLWRIAIAAPAPRDIEYSTIDALGNFVRRVPEARFSALKSSVASVSETAIANELGYTSADAWIDAAYKFEESHILDLEFVGSRICNQLAITAGQVLAPQPASAGAVRILDKYVWRATREAGHSDVLKVNEAISSCKWLPSGTLESLRLEVAGGLRRFGKLAPPYTGQQVAEFVAGYGEIFEWGLRAWLEAFASNTADVRAATVTYTHSTLPDAVAAGLKSYAKRVPSGVKLELLQPLLVFDPNGPPTDDYLRACGITSIDNNALAGELVDLYNRATRNAQREIVLRLWRLAAPTDDRSRRRLIESIYIPLLKSGNQGFDLAGRYVQLCQPVPRGVTQALRRALSAGRWNPVRAVRARARLRELGL